MRFYLSISLVVKVFINQTAIILVASWFIWLVFSSPLAMHFFVVYLGRAAGHIASQHKDKITEQTTEQTYQTHKCEQVGM